MSDQLASYKRKRDFSRTPEPSGSVGEASGAPRFVVQRHRARRLHYDFRLEIDGVLVSWAVPRGPSLDPKVRRAAFHVEDHPLSYFDFEGVIPAGQYGGGDVIVWDVGTWRLHRHHGGKADPGAAVAAGEIHIDLHGEKLHGRFVLVRTRTGGSGRDEWLLLHKNDEFAVRGWDPEDHPHSVLSGRTNDEVKADPDRLWHSDRPNAVVLKPTSQELAALDDITGSGRWRIFGRAIQISNVDNKKRELLHYTAQVASSVLPYLTGRILQLPKRLPARAPQWLTRSEGQLVIEEPAALVWAVNFGAIEWRTSAFRTDEPGKPTHAVIELGPPTAWRDVLVLTRLHRTALEHLGLTARAKLTGARGVEIWVPLSPGPNLEYVRDWARDLSEAVSAVVPDLRVALAQPGETLLAPYSPREAARSPVSAPIEWDELDDLDPLAPPTIRTMPKRLADRGDLFRDVLNHAQRLPKLTL